MLPYNRLIETSRAIITAIVLFYAVPVYAATATLSASAIISNIAEQMPALLRLVTAVGFVMGMYFVVTGIFKLKHYGEQRTQMSQEHSLKGPILYLVVGTMLLYLPGAIKTGMSTFWTKPNPYAYLEATNQWAELFSQCFIVVQLFGVIAFIRGLVMLTHLAGHGGHGASFNRAMTHIIGGIFCINIYQFVQVVAGTLGLQVA